MKAVISVVVVLGVLCLGIPMLVGQDKSDTSRSETIKKTDENQQPQKETEVGEKLRQEINGLVKALGHDEFEAREKAYTQLRKLGEKARQQLKAALDSEDPEIRWRASRLLALLDDENVEGRKPGDRRRSLRFFSPRRSGTNGQGDQAPFDPFENLSRHLNTLFDDLIFEDEQFKPFQFQFFEDDPIDIDKLLEDFRRKTGSLNIQADGSTLQYRFKRIDNGKTTSFTVNVAPDGSVEAQVTKKNEDGEEETQIYTAESLEELRKKHPEVVEQLQLDGFRVSIDIPDVFGQRWQGLGLRLDRAPFGFDKKLQRKVFGVYTEAMTPVLQAHLDLEEDEGVIVTGTSRGSFAESIGIQAMDVIVALDGKKIGSADDMRRMMAKIEKDQILGVSVIRKGQRLELEGTYTLPTAGSDR